MGLNDPFAPCLASGIREGLPAGGRGREGVLHGDLVVGRGFRWHRAQAHIGAVAVVRELRGAD